MAEIEIRNVVKTYAGGQTAVHGIDLSIDHGELVVLVGPSGCGKSTLLRMIAGLERITDGTISIEGRVVNDIEPAARDIAMVFQNYALYPHMTVRQNLAYGLKNRGVDKALIAQKIDHAATMLKIDHMLDRRPAAMSGGQRHRVAMGRAIVREPKVFLFDEPLSNLDAKLRGQMRVEIRKLQQRLGTTSIYVTHDQLEAMTMADKLVVMNAGRIEQIGTPQDIYTRPASTFVASFMGAPAMNLIPRAAVAGVALPQGTQTVGLRAEDIGPAGGEGVQFAGSITTVELTGADSLVYLALAGCDQDVVLRLSGSESFAAGQSLRFSIPAARLHCFDGEGRRIG